MVYNIEEAMAIIKGKKEDKEKGTLPAFLPPNERKVLPWKDFNPKIKTDSGIAKRMRGEDVKKGAVKQFYQEQIEEKFPRTYPPKKESLDPKDQDAVQAERDAKAGVGDHDIHGQLRKEAGMVTRESKFDVLVDLIKQGGGMFPVPEDVDEKQPSRRKDEGGGGMFPMPETEKQPWYQAAHAGKGQPAGDPEAQVRYNYEKPSEVKQDAVPVASEKKPPVEAGKPPKPGYKLQEVIVKLPGGKQFKSHRWVKGSEPDKVEHKAVSQGKAEVSEHKVQVTPTEGHEKKAIQQAGVALAEKAKGEAEKQIKPKRPVAGSYEAQQQFKQELGQALWGMGQYEGKGQKEAVAVAEKPYVGDKGTRTPKPAEGKEHLAQLDDKELGQRLDWYEHRYYSAKDDANEEAKKAALWRLIAAQKEARKRGFNWKPVKERAPGETGGLGAGHAIQHFPPGQSYGLAPKKPGEKPGEKPQQAVVAGEKPGGDAKLVDVDDGVLIDRFKHEEDAYYKYKEAGDKELMQKQVWKIVAIKKEMKNRGIQFKKSYDQELWKAMDDVEKEIVLQELLLKACDEGEPIKEPFDIKKPSATVLKKILPLLAAGLSAGAGAAGAAGAGAGAAGAGAAGLGAAAAPAAAGAGAAGGGAAGGFGASFKSGLGTGLGQGVGQKLTQDEQTSHDTSVPGVILKKAEGILGYKKVVAKSDKGELPEYPGQKEGKPHRGWGPTQSTLSGLGRDVLKKAMALGLIKSEEIENDDEDGVKAKLLATVLRSYGTYLASANEAKEANRQLDAAAALQGMYTEATT